MEEKMYECKQCGKKVKSSEDTKFECCGEPMRQIPLDQCTEPHSAEYSGPFEEDKPCDEHR